MIHDITFDLVLILCYIIDKKGSKNGGFVSEIYQRFETISEIRSQVSDSNSGQRVELYSNLEYNS